MRLPDDLIAELDAEAQERGLSRTAVMEDRLRGREAPVVPAMPEVAPKVSEHVARAKASLADLKVGLEQESEAPVMTCPDCGARPTSPKVLAEGKCFFCRRKLVAA